MKSPNLKSVGRLIAVCLLVRLATPAGAQAPDNWSRRLPADTWLMAAYNGRAWSSKSMEATPLGRILAEPQVRKYVDDVIGPLLGDIKKAAIAEARAPAGKNPIEAIWTLCEVVAGGQYALALIGVDADEKGPPRPQGVAGVRPGARRAEFAAAVSTLEELLGETVGRLKDAAGNPVRIENRELDGQKLKTLRCPVGPQALVVNWGWVGDDFVIAVGDRAERVVYGRDRPAAGLFDQPGFRKAAKTIHGVAGRDDMIGMVYVNAKAVRSTLEPMMPPEMRRLLAATGLDALDVFAESLRIEDGRFRTTTAAEVSERRGLFKVCSAPADEGVLRLVPRSAKFFAAIPLDGGSLFDLIRGVAESVGPRNAARDFDAAVEEMLSKPLGMDFRRDLLGSPAGRVVIVGAPEDGFPVYGGVTAVIELKDAAKVRGALDRVYGMLSEAAAEGAGRGRGGLFGFAPVFSRDHGAHRIRGVNLAMAAPCWTVTDKYLIVGVNPQAMVDYLNFLADPKAPTIRDNPDFAAGLKAVGGVGEGMGYSDLRALWGLLHGLAIIGVHAGEAALRQEFRRPPFQPTLKPELFPSVGAVKPHITGMVSAVRWEGNTLRLEAVGPLPMPTPGTALTLLAAGAGGFYFLARPQAVRAQGMVNLHQLGVAIEVYRQDKRADPKDLDALRPYFAGDEFFQRLVNHPEHGRLEYFGARGPRRADRPLAAYAPDRGGMRLVLMGDGSVQRLPATAVQRALNDAAGKDEKK